VFGSTATAVRDCGETLGTALVSYGGLMVDVVGGPNNETVSLNDKVEPDKKNQEQNRKSK
jgi:hypothetical protein